MIDLKWLNPCPTCGKKDEINSGQTSPGRYFVRCNRCRVKVSDDREEKVQAEWNEIGHYLRGRVKELEFGAQVDSDCIESQSNEIDELKAWKESAMTEAEKLDIQSIGMEIGCKLGSSIPEQVLPWIREQKAKIASYESSIDGLKKVVDSLYNLKS